MRTARFRTAGFAIAMACLAATSASADDKDRDAAPTSVVELFTSQGCSSCPPADRLAADLSAKGDTLVLTLAVDYWDYLGWKDTLASPANSARQRAYAMSRGDRKVFTPQIVVNGRDSLVGGDKRAVESAMRRVQTDGGFAVPVDLEVEDGRVEVALAGPRRVVGAGHGEVWAFGIRRSQEVEIGRGENAGRTVVYANVVRHMTRLGAWDGGPAKFEVPVAEVLGPDCDGVAVLVQAGNGGKPGEIFGAAQAAAVAPEPVATTTSGQPRRGAMALEGRSGASRGSIGPKGASHRHGARGATTRRSTRSATASATARQRVSSSGVPSVSAQARSMPAQSTAPARHASLECAPCALRTAIARSNRAERRSPHPREASAWRSSTVGYPSAGSPSLACALRVARRVSPPSLPSTSSSGSRPSRT